MIPAIFPNKNDTRLEYPFTNEKCLMLLCSLAGIPSGRRSHSWLEYIYIYILIGNTSTQSGAPIFQVSAMLDDPGVCILFHDFLFHWHHQTLAACATAKIQTSSHCLMQMWQRSNTPRGHTEIMIG